MDTSVQNKTTRTSRDWQIVQSDRNDLLQRAIDVISVLRGSPGDIPQALMDAELHCYEAALDLLKHEFRSGPSPWASRLVKIDEEESVEYQTKKEETDMKT